MSSLASFDKSAIVIEIGSRFVRAGYGGEHKPRVTLSTPSALQHELSPHSPASAEPLPITTLSSAVESLFRDIFLQCLQINAKGRKVLIVEPILGTDRLKPILQEALTRMKIASTQFISSPIASSYCSGRPSGALVIDIGEHEAKIMPVYDGRPIVGAFQFSPSCSANSLRNSLLQFLCDNNANLSPATCETCCSSSSLPSSSSPSISLSTSDLDDILCRACAALPRMSASLLSESLLSPSLSSSAKPKPCSASSSSSIHQKQPLPAQPISKTFEALKQAEDVVSEPIKGGKDYGDSGEADEGAAKELDGDRLYNVTEAVLYQPLSQSMKPLNAGGFALSLSASKSADSINTVITIDKRARCLTAETALFQLNEDGVSLPTLVLESLLKCEIDVRREVSSNILVVGGIASSLPGLSARLQSDLQHILSAPKKNGRWESLTGLSGKIQVVQKPSFAPSLSAWLGASLVASLPVQ